MQMPSSNAHAPHCEGSCIEHNAHANTHSDCCGDASVLERSWRASTSERMHLISSKVPGTASCARACCCCEVRSNEATVRDDYITGGSLLIRGESTICHVTHLPTSSYL